MLQALSVGLATGLAALMGSAVIVKRHFRNARPDLSDRPSAAVVLFKSGKVIDSTREIAPLFGDYLPHWTDWSDVRKLLEIQFPGFPDAPPETPMRLQAQGDSDTFLQLVPNGRYTRLILNSPPLGAAEQHRLRLEHAEYRQFCDNMNITPHPIWQTGPDGRVIWRNQAYEALCTEAGRSDERSCLFDLAPGPSSGTRTARVSLTLSRHSRQWFEVKTRPLDTGWLHVAHGIDSLVEAELAQRNFVQTLTKTFAHLPIGLAVFDRDRRLVLFNPALVDLTRLPPDFLSARPNLLSFFDNMRERRMMPEPKNYAVWREELAQVVTAARDDRYCETWNLPSGLTYKITGRPHPDGAVAFLLEDISAEISLTRRFRSELELTQSVIDSLDDAVVVFGQSGSMNFANRAYEALWHAEAAPGLLDTDITDATRHWQAACEPSPVWAELRDFVMMMRDRASWDFQLRMTSGTMLTCHVVPAPGGSTVMRFAERQQVACPLHPTAALVPG